MDSLISFCMFLSLNNFTNRSKKKKKKIGSLAFPIKVIETKKILLVTFMDALQIIK